MIVGLETAVEMNLVQIGTNEFFPNSPLLNSRKPSITIQEIEWILLCYVARPESGRDARSCVPPCFKWTGITQCSAGAAVI